MVKQITFKNEIIKTSAEIEFFLFTSVFYCSYYALCGGVAHRNLLPP